jgi:hypothetical protein
MSTAAPPPPSSSSSTPTPTCKVLEGTPYNPYDVIQATPSFFLNAVARPIREVCGHLHPGYFNCRTRKKGHYDCIEESDQITACAASVYVDLFFSP